ncbi:MAG: hypothetical protein K8U57_12045 [Planctomycetes bacterium]|nr:hypothetical protein [Planctomycetota bacterium]
MVVQRTPASRGSSRPLHTGNDENGERESKATGSCDADADLVHPGRILIGIQVPEADRVALRDFTAALGYPDVDDTESPIFRLLLR